MGKCLYEVAAVTCIQLKECTFIYNMYIILDAV